MVKYTRNLLLLSKIFPYFTRGSKIKNRYGLLNSILFSNKYDLKFKNGIEYTCLDSKTLFELLAVEKYAVIFKRDKNKVIISFDGLNKFSFSIGSLNQEDKRLISLFCHGIRDGAYFLDKDHNSSIQDERIIKIMQAERSIIQTYEGIRFYLDSIGADSFVEIFVRRIHRSYSNDLQNKIVVDAGAFIGDTPLYFASMGATVYAFELTKTNYEQMLQNLELNKQLITKIIPIHTGIGKDGIIEYAESTSDDYSGGASFIINKYGKNSTKEKVEGMTIRSVVEKYNISSIDLLKLDCKGCEYLVTEDDLKKVHKIKIEYYSYLQGQKLENLIGFLKKTGFDSIVYKHNPIDIGSFGDRGYILAIKQQTLE